MTIDDFTSEPKSSVGFISFTGHSKMVAGKIGLLERDVMSDADIYAKIETLDLDERLSVIKQLGSHLEEEHYHLFVDALASTLVGGILDVTGWNRLSIKAVLVVCSERNLSIAFKNGERTISPVSYPTEGPLLETFVDAILTGRWI